MFRRNLEQADLAAHWSVSSAGTWAYPGEPAIAAVSLMAARYGLDLSRHRSRRVNKAMLLDADLTLVMQSGQKEALLSEFPALHDHVHLLSEVAEHRTYDIPDALATENEMAEVVSELHALLTRGMESICVLATYLNNSRRMHDN
jgi:protein-tyrosine-phosphatase